MHPPFVCGHADFLMPTDAPPPYVGSYPFRSSAGGVTPASRAVTREQGAQQSLAANLVLHFAAPAIADDDVTVAQGLRYPQRYVALEAGHFWSADSCTLMQKGLCVSPRLYINVCLYPWEDK